MKNLNLCIKVAFNFTTVVFFVVSDRELEVWHLRNMDSHTLEQRSVIKFLSKGVYATDIHQSMLVVYGDGAPSYGTETRCTVMVSLNLPQ